MNWRDILEGGNSHREPYSHNSHNSHKYPEPVNCANTANIANSKTESEAALQAFVKLVRAEGACEHRFLFSRAEILAELDEQSGADLLTTTREQRQSWAASIAARLARRRIGPGWEVTPIRRSEDRPIRKTRR